MKLYCRVFFLAWLIPLLGASSSSAEPDRITIAPSADTVYQSSQVQIKTARGGESTVPVKWDVDGIPGGSAEVGTISATGLYIAPAYGLGIFTVEAVDFHGSAVTKMALSVIEDPELTEAHEEWMAGVEKVAASYGCRGEVIQQQPSESISDVIKLFSLKDEDSNCIALLPVSTDKTSMRYSFSWGGKIDGKDVYYLSDVGQKRIWNGVAASAR